MNLIDRNYNDDYYINIMGTNIGQRGGVNRSEIIPMFKIPFHGLLFQDC